MSIGQELESSPLPDGKGAALAPRERILRTASDLFYRFSIHTIGIDRIIAESGVAKKTFYKHYPSKSHLIATYLRHKNDVWLEMLAVSSRAAGLSPLDRVLTIFDALAHSMALPSFQGCPFVKGMAEFGPEAEAPEVQATIAVYFESLHGFVTALIKPLALRNPEMAVLQILSLIQGSIVMAQSLGNPTVATANRDAARRLLQDDGDF